MERRRLWLGARRLVRCGSSAVVVPYEFEKLYTHNHLGLPRLPIPALPDTVERYLDSVRPLAAGPDEYTAHEQLVRDFQRSAGEELDRELRDLDTEHAAKGGYPYFYFEPVWDRMYLAARAPTPITTNPALAFNAAPWEFDQFSVSARFLNSFGKWIHKLRSGAMAPDAPDSDMSQFYFHVGTSRVPKVGMDSYVADHHSRHVVVIHRDSYFRLDIIDDQGRHVSVPALRQALEEIPQLEPNPSFVGRLTAADRDVWATNRERLETSSPANAQSLKAIDTALLVIVFEDAEPPSVYEGMDIWLKAVESRWYDKHQLIVTHNGLVGLNFEHAFSDGWSLQRWMRDVWAAVRGDYAALPSVAETSETPAVQVLEWHLPPEVYRAALDADLSFRAAAKDCELRSMSLPYLAREEAKARKMPADATAQLAMHLAHGRLHGYMAPTYESCSTRRYFHGRTETIRSATPEAQQFVRAMLSAETPTAARWELYQAAAAKHLRLAQQAACGQGVDRHLMMLRALGARRPRPHPLLADPLFARSATWRLSTSNLSNPFFGAFCFGAVDPAGYGIGYAVHSGAMMFAVSSYASNATTDTGAFCSALERSVEDIVHLSAEATRH